MKKELIYFAVFIYGMVMLMTLSNKKNATAGIIHNGLKTKTYTNSTDVKEGKTATAQKFFSSNQKFASRFSDNQLSFLY